MSLDTRARQAGTDRVPPVRPDTIARSIAIGNPSDGTYVVRIARETGGVVEAVTEEEIVDAIRLLARTEGIFTEPAGGVTVKESRDAPLVPLTAPV